MIDGVILVLVVAVAEPENYKRQASGGTMGRKHASMVMLFLAEGAHPVLATP